jgi:hypothetical protein
MVKPVPAPPAARMAHLWAVSLLLIGAPVMAVEEPPFEVVDKLGEVEVRSYPSLIVAETEVSGEFDRVGNQAFRRLAGYIFGGNRVAGNAGEGEKIAMTAPVAMRPAASARIDMTAPVSLRAAGPEAPSSGPDIPAGGTWVMSFTMPSSWTLETLPRPLDPLVTLRRTPARKVAVLRFSGSWSAERFAEQERRLRSQLANSRWRAVGAAESMRYDPPWTLWFLRRNEVALPVEDLGGTDRPGGS